MLSQGVLEDIRRWEGLSHAQLDPALVRSQRPAPPACRPRPPLPAGGPWPAANLAGVTCRCDPIHRAHERRLRLPDDLLSLAPVVDQFSSVSRARPVTRRRRRCGQRCRTIERTPPTLRNWCRSGPTAAPSSSRACVTRSIGDEADRGGSLSFAEPDRPRRWCAG
jgi:hypothetical protein